MKELQIGLFLIVYDRYQLMTDCWKEEPKARPSFYQLIEKLEIIMQKDAPYLDVNKHNEAHPSHTPEGRNITEALVVSTIQRGWLMLTQQVKTWWLEQLAPF